MFLFCSLLFSFLGRGLSGRPTQVWFGDDFGRPLTSLAGPPWVPLAPSSLLLGSPLWATTVVGASLPFPPWGVGGSVWVSYPGIKECHGHLSVAMVAQVFTTSVLTEAS